MSNERKPGKLYVVLITATNQFAGTLPRRPVQVTTMYIVTYVCVCVCVYELFVKALFHVTSWQRLIGSKREIRQV